MNKQPHAFLGVLLAPALLYWLLIMDFCVLPSLCRSDCWDGIIQMCSETFKRSHWFLLKRNPQQRWILTAAKREPICDTKHNYHWPRHHDQCAWNHCAWKDPSKVHNHAQGLLPRKEDCHLAEVLQTYLWLHGSGKPRYSTPTEMLSLTGPSPCIRNRVYDTVDVVIFKLEVTAMDGVFGISCPQVMFRMGCLMTGKFSAIITGIRCYLVNLKLRNPPKTDVSMCFMCNVLFAEVFTQLSINSQSSAPACSSLMVISRNGSLGKVF